MLLAGLRPAGVSRIRCLPHSAALRVGGARTPARLIARPSAFPYQRRLKWRRNAAVPLSFHPGPGTIVICDYTTGFQAPEMVKIRPVVVISPRRRAAQLVTVVPLSSVQPSPAEPWHHLLSPGAYPPARGPIWAKCDMVATVALSRLDRVKIKQGGIRSYCVYRIAPADLSAIMAGVKAALGLP
jgi:mRNA interferase MazF